MATLFSECDSISSYVDGRDDGVASIVTELTHRESVGPGLGKY